MHFTAINVSGGGGGGDNSYPNEVENVYMTAPRNLGSMETNLVNHLILDEGDESKGNLLFLMCDFCTNFITGFGYQGPSLL